MKKLKALFAQLNTRSGRAGLYSAAVSIFVVGMLLCINIFVGALPAEMTEYDLTSNEMFTLSQQTKDLLNSLDEQVTLHWICQPGKEDSYVERLLECYEGHCPYITLEKVDPDLNPTFVSGYQEELNNNGVIVLQGERYRYVDVEDIYLETFSYQTYDYIYEFDGENAVTSAIDYVTAPDLPTIGLLTEHGEQELGQTYRRSLTLENILFKEISLMREGGVPADVDILLINQPQQDVDPTEAMFISQFLDQGGHLMLISRLNNTTSFDNLHGIMAQYGMTAVPGVACEPETQNFYYSQFEIIPQVNDHPITQNLTGSDTMILLPDSHGIWLEAQPGDTLVSLLDSSGTAYSKTGQWPLQTYLKEEGDIDGPFSFAALCTRGRSQVLWLASSYVTDDSSISLSNNLDLFMNSVNWISQRENRISIRPKPMDDPRLVINAQSADTMKLLFVGIIPLAYLGIGLSIFIRRKRK